MAENKTQRNLKQLKDFKVVSERKLIAEQLTGFDCQHCDNIISIGSSTPNGLNVKFANHVTGNTQEVLLPTFPNVAPLTETSEWAKFGHLFWIKYNFYKLYYWCAANSTTYIATRFSDWKCWGNYW